MFGENVEQDFVGIESVVDSYFLPNNTFTFYNAINFFTYNYYINTTEI